MGKITEEDINKLPKSEEKKVEKANKAESLPSIDELKAKQDEQKYQSFLNQENDDTYSLSHFVNPSLSFL